MKDVIAERIAESIPGSRVEVAVDGNRAVITVISDHFTGMSRVQKHQAVYGCIESFIADGSLHAVSIKALTPTE
ncbi:MAG: BolA/IbaG family iron-sulfur metabolism protein [Gammaproteobacteria bacterium]|nr:BolA/IbaG family iron-sulfur metabolism protein [Gammaproteobacteria bacterium]